MSNSRRRFLALSSFGLLGTAAALRGHAPQQDRSRSLRDKGQADTVVQVLVVLSQFGKGHQWL
jgi:hypothetical protein